MSENGPDVATLMVPDAESVSASNVLASLANYVDSIPVKSSKDKKGKVKKGKVKKGKATWANSKLGKSKLSKSKKGKSKKGKSKKSKADKGKAKQNETHEDTVEMEHGGSAQGGSAHGAVVQTSGMVNLKCAQYTRKVNNGGRTANPDCDALRRTIHVPVYNDGLFKGMWNIDPLGNTVTSQTTKLYQTFATLIEDETTYKVYVCAPSMGHMWFPRVDGGITSYLSAITLNADHYNFLWKNVTTHKANIDKQQSTVNKLILTLGFSQKVLDNVGGLVRLTFNAEKCTSQANALLKCGVGGGGIASTYKGRAVLVAMPGPVAVLPK